MHSWTIRLRDVRHLLKRAKELELSNGAVQRLKWFSYALEHDGNVSLTCRHFGIARSTFLRWAERFNARDIRTVEEESRRPHTVRAPETAPHVVALIRQIRQEHPLMGKDAVAALLRSQYGIDVSASTVGRTIARHGLFFAGTKTHEQKRSAAPSPLPSARVDDAAGSSPFPMLPTIGTTLALMLSVIGACMFPSTVQAAQSNNFVLHEAGPGHAAGVPHGSTNYLMQGDLTWRQESPLHSNSFMITAGPVPQTSSSVATSSAQSSTSTPDDGGHRGEGTTTTNPPSSRSSSISSAPSSAASSAPAVTTSSASSTSSSVVSSEDLRPAAKASSSTVAPIASSVSSTITSTLSASSSSTSIRSVTSSCGYMDRQTVLCHEPFYRPIELTPESSGTPARSIAESIATEYATLTHGSAVVSLALLLILAIMLSTVVGYFNSKASESTRFVRNTWYVILVAFAAITVVFFTVQHARAAVTSPQRHVYNGHLLNASGTPITTPHYIRFSEWYNRDMVASDVVAGVINTGAATYAGYQEVHVVTPDSQGYFSVILGTGAALPNLATLATSDLDNLFLQVEVKAAGSLDSAYELLDVNPSDTTIDRSPILSVPFAQNADLLDQREIGTGSGSIPLLGSGGLLPVATVPGGTNRNAFTIDADNTASTLITLQFGQALAKTLSYDIVNDRFTFNADVRVEGDLVVTGLINGIDISTLGTSDAGKLRVSSGAGLTISITGGAYRINGDVTDYSGASGIAVAANATNYVFIGSGGLTVRTSGYPTDESFIRLATVVTNGSAVTLVNDHRVTQSDDREEIAETNMHAEFPNSSYQGDATDNTGQLSVSLDNITQRNFYLWTSTRATLQDYDVVVRVSLPADFVRWDSAPMNASYRTTSADAANSKVDISVFDTNGTAVTLGGSATGLASTSWATTSLTFDTGATWTAGSEFLVKFKLYAKDNFQAHVGSVKLKYIRLVP